MASSSSAACVSCQLPLTLQVEHDEEGVESMEEAGEVDDDLQVQCGCHFHWCEIYRSHLRKQSVLNLIPLGNVCSIAIP